MQMNELRRRLLLAALASPLVARAQGISNRPVRFVLGQTPATTPDLVARTLAPRMQAKWNQPFIVENKGGAGGTLGTNDVAKSPPDGSSFAFTDSSFMISAGLYPKLPYDPLKDLAPVTLAVEAAAILIARQDLPAKNVREMVALAKAKPRTLTYGSGGQGSSAHLAMELLLIQAGAEMVHVPFKGVAAAIAEVVGGRIDVSISSVGAALGHVKGGKVRALAVTGKERLPSLPDVATFAESGFPDYEMLYRFGFLAPAGTPAAIVLRMRDEVAKAGAKPRVRDLLAPQGARMVASTPAEYAAIIDREMRMWKTVIDKAGVKVE